MTAILITAATVGFFHTLFGPDHYLPFIVMSKSGKWSYQKTFLITFLCGLGHIGSSVVFGMIGIAVGIAVSHLQVFEAFRGNIAAWLLILFGFAYFVWGLKNIFKNKPHQHAHVHEDGTVHEHTHNHQNEHTHIHESKRNLTPWILFTIFLFGPCEPLIPIVMYPAAQKSWANLAVVTGVFGAVTIGTMLTIITISYFGLSFLPLKKIEKYSPSLAGLVIFLCGISIQFFGL
jgi:nickel/cobalt transporter (NicO) family protein